MATTIEVRLVLTVEEFDRLAERQTTRDFPELLLAYFTSEDGDNDLADAYGPNAFGGWDGPYVSAVSAELPGYGIGRAVTFGLRQNDEGE